MIKKNKKKKITFTEAVANISATMNNTIVSISDRSGNVICWASAGSANFKGAKKSTPFAAQSAAEIAGKKAFDLGIRQIDVKIKGPGPGRESSVRGLAASGLKINAIIDVTVAPHNGCRPSKRPRG